MRLCSGILLNFFPQIGRFALSSPVIVRSFPVCLELFHRSQTAKGFLYPVFFSTTTRMSAPAESLVQPELREEVPVKVVESNPILAENPEVVDEKPRESSSVPKSYFNFRKDRPKWENRSRSRGGEPTDHQKKKLKKVAILMGYSGQGYNGMQWNPEVETIESVLFSAMAKVELIPKDWASDLQQLNFQRCARTDKGVSAAGQVVSVPIPVPTDEINNAVVDKINAELPPAIRLFGLKKVTRGFNSKNWCSARTYLYMMPTFGFAPLEAVVCLDYRIPADRLVQVNQLLAKFLGSNNFHNFTVGVKPWQDAAKRFMKEVTCGEAFVRDGVEFVVITVKGQSFMMHQIRKMVGLVIAIMRGHVGPEIFDTVYGPQKADIPRAPGLGLLLQAVHFDMYNAKFGNDGMHDELIWPECESAVEKFKEEFIYPSMVKGEKEELSMLTWLGHLPNHVFGYRQHEETGSEPSRSLSALGDAKLELDKARSAESSGDEGAVSDSGESKPAKKKARVDVI